MTVGELIAELQKHPASMLVRIESSWGEYSPDDVQKVSVGSVRASHNVLVPAVLIESS